MKNPLQNWIPTKLTFQIGELLAKWQFFGDLSYTDPFFETVIQKSNQLPENNHGFQSMTSLDSLLEYAENLPSIAPSAFVFHVSRCGSTLITQLLGLDKKNIVISEPSILDEALREFSFKINPNLPFDPAMQSVLRMLGRKSSLNDSMEDLQGNRPELDEKYIEQVVQAIVKVLGQKRSGNEQNLIIKLDSWHIFYYEKLRKLYPNTPFIFTYRRPDEVIRSQMQSNGMNAIPGLVQLELFDIELFELINSDSAVFVAKILEKYYEKFISISHVDKNTLFLNYRDGIMPNMQKIENYLNLSFDSDLKQKMVERSGFHSKNPTQSFHEEPITTEIPAYQKKVFELYEAFEDSLKSH